MDGTPLGILGAPPVATIDDQGVVELAGSGPTLRWWVVAEDRVHVTEREVATRRRRVDQAPVVETAMKVPGGDVVGTVFAFSGGDVAALAFEVVNRTAVPVAIAVVVGPGEVSRSGGDVLLDGAVVLRSSRRVGRSVVADSLEEIEGLVGRDADGATEGKWGAVVVPLPHSQSVTIVTADADAATAPTSEQVAAGWTRQVARGTRLELGDDPRSESWEVDRRDLLLGGHLAGSSDVSALARRIAALLRLGWMEDASAATEQLLSRQRARGHFEADDRVAATIAAVGALGAWARSGLPGDAFAGFVEPLGRASAWLSRRGGRSLGSAERVRAAAAIAGAAPLMELAGQHDAAAAMATTALVATAGDGPRRPLPAVDASGRLIELVDSIALEVPDGLVLLRGTELAATCRTIEVFDLPTRWGRLSFAVRWHGERAALLWEVDPLGVGPFAEPTVSAPGLDEWWAARVLRGESLVTR
jgi:hypothetical protein